MNERDKLLAENGLLVKERDDWKRRAEEMEALLSKNEGRVKQIVDKVLLREKEALAVQVAKLREALLAFPEEIGESTLQEIWNWWNEVAAKALSIDLPRVARIAEAMKKVYHAVEALPPRCENGVDRGCGNCAGCDLVAAFAELRKLEEES